MPTSGTASTASDQAIRQPGRHNPGLGISRRLAALVSGTREHAAAMREHAAAVLAPMGLRLSAEKTKITHIDEGPGFLGWHIQRHRKRGTAVLRLHLSVPAQPSRQ